MLKVQVQSKTVAVFCRVLDLAAVILAWVTSKIVVWNHFLWCLFLKPLEMGDALLRLLCWLRMQALGWELQLEPSLRREMWQLEVFVSTNGLTDFICTKSVSVWVSLSDYWRILSLSMLPGKQGWWPCISIMLHSSRTSWESILFAEWSINFALRDN